MTKLAEKIKDIDLIRLAEAEGVTLRRSGQSWSGLCPLHEEKTPSFTIRENHFKCFGCGAHGDAIDFVRQLKGLSFKEACHYLGVILPGRPATKAERKQVQAKAQERKHKRDLVDAFRTWECNYSTTLGKRIRGAYRWIAENVHETSDLAGMKGDTLAGLYRQLPMWEWGLKVLASGNDEEKFRLFEVVNESGF